MTKTNTFENLLIWQKSHQFVLSVYKLSDMLPNDEKFGLISQIRRASISIPANIAEGYGRRGFNDKLRFYNISRASLLEVRYFLILIRDLQYSNTDALLNDLDEIEKMLYSYVKKMKE